MPRKRVSPYLPSYMNNKNKLCRACGDKASGLHYKRMTCEACKGFFRRAINYKQNGIEMPACPTNGQCAIDKSTRVKCKRCRLQRCLDIGMAEELVMTSDQRTAKRCLINKNKRKRAGSDQELFKPATAKDIRIVKHLTEIYKNNFEDVVQLNQNYFNDVFMISENQSTNFIFLTMFNQILSFLVAMIGLPNVRILVNPSPMNEIFGCKRTILINLMYQFMFLRAALQWPQIKETIKHFEAEERYFSEPFADFISHFSLMVESIHRSRERHDGQVMWDDVVVFYHANLVFNNEMSDVDDEKRAFFNFKESALTFSARQVATVAARHFTFQDERSDVFWMNLRLTSGEFKTLVCVHGTEFLDSHHLFVQYPPRDNPPADQALDLSLSTRNKRQIAIDSAMTSNRSATARQCDVFEQASSSGSSSNCSDPVDIPDESITLNETELRLLYAILTEGMKF